MAKKKSGKEKNQHSNSEEDTLFRTAVSGVKPLSARGRHFEKSPPAHKVLSTRADERAALRESPITGADFDAIETGDKLVFQRPQVTRHVFRQLRRGRYPIQDEIDLHGMNAAEAHDMLTDFIAGCSAAGLKCVRVIHGKGLGSGPDGPVLKTRVNHWLRQWEQVLAFCSTQPQHGGTGAIYVLLRR
jgi:DNA-nicking Smr family endonuclease